MSVVRGRLLERVDEDIVGLLGWRWKLVDGNLDDDHCCSSDTSRASYSYE